MPRFLSDAWLAAVNTATSARPGQDGDPAREGRLVLEQVVTNAPGGDTRYTLVLDGAGVRVIRGDAAPADATFTEDYDTAVAIHRGDLSPQQAFMTGRIRVAGNIAALMANQDALAALEPALATVRPDTTY